MGESMDVPIEKLQRLIDMLRLNNVGYFKYDSLELRLESVPKKTSVPPAKTNNQVVQDENDILFYAVE